MLNHRLAVIACLVFASSTAAVAQPRVPALARVALRSAHFSPGVPLVKSGHPVHAVALEAEVNAKGEGRGKLTLMRTPPNYDEFGDFVTGTETDQADRTRRNGRPAMTLDCTIEFVREGAVGRVNEAPKKRTVFRLKGREIQTPMFFATTGPGLTSGRLLLHDADGRVEYVIEMSELRPAKEGPPVPCHPGCFPAGTPVATPGGARPIDRLRPGDVVTSIRPDGRDVDGVVEDVFVTRNRLVHVVTDAGTILTTAEQPLCLTGGGFRRACDLKPADAVWCWRNDKRAEAVVRAVTPTDREEPVFNLILGENAVFVAGEFLARGKPPDEAPAVEKP